jgi:hypothetical protein
MVEMPFFACGTTAVGRGRCGGKLDGCGCAWLRMTGLIPSGMKGDSNRGLGRGYGGLLIGSLSPGCFCAPNSGDVRTC